MGSKFRRPQWYEPLTWINHLPRPSINKVLSVDRKHSRWVPDVKSASHISWYWSGLHETIHEVANRNCVFAALNEMRKRKLSDVQGSTGIVLGKTNPNKRKPQNQNQRSSKVTVRMSEISRFYPTKRCHWKPMGQRKIRKSCWASQALIFTSRQLRSALVTGNLPFYI